MTATIVHRLLVDGQTWLKCHPEGTSEPSDVDAFNDALKVSAEAGPPPLTNRRQDYRMTRRSILIGAAASLICAPAVVRAASLMPVRSLPLQSLSPLGEFYRGCFYHSLDHGLRTGRSMTTSHQRENSFCSRGPPDGRVCAGTRMAATGSRLRPCCLGHRENSVMHPETWPNMQ